MTDIDIQQCQTNSALVLESIYDVSVHGLNCAVINTPQVPTIQIVGDVGTTLLSGVDAGVYPTYYTNKQIPVDSNNSPIIVPVLKVTSGGPHNAAPTDITFTGCTFQEGIVGVIVDGGSENIRFTAVTAKHYLCDGWRFNGSGTFISLTGCGGLGNGSNTGVNANISPNNPISSYDVNVTSSTTE